MVSLLHRATINKSKEHNTTNVEITSHVAHSMSPTEQQRCFVTYLMRYEPKSVQSTTKSKAFVFD